MKVSLSTPGSGTVRPLLFERLLEAGPGGAVFGSTDRPATPAETRAQVESSVAGEISALLNSRIAREVDAIDPAQRTVLDYGLPDFSGQSALSGTDRQTIARAAERAIRAFEPRLANPKVTVIEEAVGSRSLDFRISGTLVVNKVAAMHAFAISLTAAADDDGR
jgi:type VI secretion system lysozyme-like protein